MSRRFQEAVAGIYLRRNQGDVLLELPDRIEKEEWVAMGRVERREYVEQVEAGNFMGMRQRVTLAEDPTVPTAKIERLQELLEEHAQAQRKVIIFSYFLKNLDRLAELFENCGIIAGRVPLSEREEILERFKTGDGHQLLLAQITAAGQGLNLQEASVVILLEPQLTPGSEAQAIARAHRMGQTQPVRVHRLLAKNSVDERIVELLEEKRALFDDYARQSLARDLNPESTETHLVKRLIALEQERLGEGGATRAVEGS